MKKIIIATALCVAASGAWAASTRLCNLSAPTQWTAASNFTKTNFTPKCSANTYVYFDESATTSAVGANSKKGNQNFAGHSNGGAVGMVSQCAAAAACTDTEAGGVADTALSQSSS